MSAEDRKYLSCEFIEYLKNRAWSSVDLNRKADWYSGAFTAAGGAGNPSGSRIALTNIAKRRMTSIFTSFIQALADEPVSGPSTFDQLIFEAIKAVERSANPQTSNCLFTFGRSQKFVTLSLKYCYVWWFCKRTDSPQYGDLSWVERWAPYLHVPVDKYTLGHLGKVPAYNQAAYSGRYLISWKWHLGNSRYCRIQDAIKQLSSGPGSPYCDPMHYEMKEIWTRAEEDDAGE